jgi:hypothetical protein
LAIAIIVECIVAFFCGGDDGSETGTPLALFAAKSLALFACTGAWCRISVWVTRCFLAK